MTLRRRIEIMSALGAEIKKKPDWLAQAVQTAYHHNKWFTVENSWSALTAIAEHFLSEEKLTSWVSKYEIKDVVDQQKVGLVLAGNIPLVGFHDMLCVFISGHQGLIKTSSKDDILIKALFGFLEGHAPEVSTAITLVDKLKGFDAVIATGSNNSATYFEEYFGKYPNIIRKNRNAVAVLSGNETDDELTELGQDIFKYFGLGCRNVSKLYVPQGYKFDRLLGILHEEHKDLANHDKYRNNFDYNNSLFLLNGVQYLMSGSVIITESDDIASRIATMHYAQYQSTEDLAHELQDRNEEIQCVISGTALPGIDTYGFGQAQKPSLTDYADGVDTMEFLVNL